MKILLLTSFLLLSHQFYSQTWQQIPNFNDPVLALTTSGNNLIVSTGTSTQYTVDAGTNWNLLPLNLCTSFYYTQDTLYATSYDVVYKSSDNGQTWVSSSSLNSSNSYARAFTKINNAYLVGRGNGGILKSTDYGNTWSSPGTGWGGKCTDIIQSSNALYASFSGSGGFNVSNNTGSTWFSPTGNGIKIGFSWPDISSLELLCNNVVVAGVKSSFSGGIYKGVYFSSDNGHNWERKVANLMDSTINTMVSSGNVLFIGTQSDGVYYSVDIGNTWNQLNTGLLDLTVNKLHIDNNKLYAATASGVFIVDVATVFASAVPILDLGINQSGLNLTSLDSDAAYQWLNCDNFFAKILGDTNQLFTAVSNGNYALEISQFGCVDTTNCFIIDNLSIEENTFEISPLVFPNPSSGKIKVVINSQIEYVQVTVRNIVGKEILNLIKFENEFEIEIDDCNGVYFVEVVSDQKASAVFKVLKE